MGQDGTIVIVNGTALTLVLSNQSSSQMKVWNFPPTIGPYSVATVLFEFDHHMDKTLPADTGDVTYSAPNGNLSFHIHASFRKTTGSGLKFPVIPVITVTTTANNVTYNEDLDWDDGRMGFVVAGQSPNYFINNSVSGESWMQTLLPLLGDRCLRDITVPGSHDAGMSEIHSPTKFSNAENTKTQSLSIHDQLMRGSRYFDIRPIIGGGDYHTGHYAHLEYDLVDLPFDQKLELSSYQGARGQSIDSIIRDINNFTATHNELIILKLSHDLNTDSGNSSYHSFTKGEYQHLLQLLFSRLNYLYAAEAGTDVTLIPLNQLISGRPVVIVFVEASDKVLRVGDATRDYTTLGFYRLKDSIGLHVENNGAMKTLPPAAMIPSEPPAVSVYDDYSGTEDLDKMMKDQISKMENFNFGGTHSLFSLSWTLTLSDKHSVEDGIHLGDTVRIEDIADKANRHIYDQILPKVAYGVRPSIVYLDYYSRNSFTALIVAINLKIMYG